MFALLWELIIGLVVGAVAKFVMPGKDPGGIWITMIIGIAGHADFSNYFLPLCGAVTATNLADARKQGGVFAYGDFITVVINFAIVALALFVVIKGINTLNRKPPPTVETAPPPPSPEVVLLTQIRDELAARR